MPRQDIPAARVAFSKSDAASSVGIYGHAAGGELGIPTVEIDGPIDHMRHMLPETAERLADALRLAASIARGQPQPPTLLERFLTRR